MGDLRVWDFSQIRFTNDTGPSLPRRQRLRIRGMVGQDTGDEIILDAQQQEALLEAQLANTEGLSDEEVRVTTGQTAADDAPRDQFRWLGNSGTVDGYRVVTGRGGNWQRAIDRGRVNLRRFGLRDMTVGTPDNKGVIEDFISWAGSSTGTSGTVEQKACGFIPASKYAHYMSSYPTIPGTNHYDVKFEGEGSYTATHDYYGNAAWQDPSTIGGSVLFCPGTDVFRLENTGNLSLPGESYHRLTLVNLALQTYGTGMGINMKVPATGEWQSGLVQLNNVTIGGAKVGWSIASVEKSSSYNVRIYGCETGLMLGSTYESGVTIHEITGLDIQACTNAIEIKKVLHSFAVYGGNWQGLSNALIKAGAGATALGCCFYNIRAEIYDKWLDLHSSLGQMGVVMQDCSLSGQNGDAAPGGPARVYGSGWTFRRVNDTGTITFEGAADQDTIFQECIPATTNQASAPTHFWSINADNVVYRQDNATMGAGTLALAWPKGFVTREIGGNITIGLPTGGYPVGKTYRISLFQGGAGGFTVSFAAGWHATSLYSNAGNVAGTRCEIEWYVQINGEPYIKSVSNWHTD